MGSVEPAHSVIIVGAGPVGLTLALILHAFGHKPIILERHAQHYPQPRAVGIYHQAVQVYNALGLREALFEAAFKDIRGQISNESQLIGTDGTAVMSVAFNGELKNGTSRSYAMHQPTVEKVLESACQKRNIPVLRSHRVLDVQDQGSRVQVRVCGPDGEYGLSAHFVAGCDGARSIVRQCAGIQFIDSGGICSRWLVVDVTPKSTEHAQQWKDAFTGKQYMDFRRPHTSVPSPLERRRWEFMLFDGESDVEAKDPQFVWPLLAKFGCTPDNAIIDRSAVYPLEGRWAETFHKGRLLLAGDAAHTAPPFLGQGFNSGIRDATTAAWRLDFALRNPDRNYQRLLQDYADEQGSTTQRFVNGAVQLERLFCVTDEHQARRRDAIVPQARPTLDLEKLDEPGMFIPVPGKFDPVDSPGHQFIDDVVQIDNAHGRLYELVKFGWLILQAEGTDNGKDAVSEKTMRQFQKVLGGTRLTVGNGGFQDTKGRIKNFFSDNGVVGVILRPDHYVYAVAVKAAEIEGLVQGLLHYAD